MFRFRTAEGAPLPQQERMQDAAFRIARGNLRLPYCGSLLCGTLSVNSRRMAGCVGVGLRLTSLKKRRAQCKPLSLHVQLRN